MSDRTPHEGGRQRPEDLLDALLARNRAELLGTMTQALDTNAGLRALATLRTGSPPKIENRRPSEAEVPPELRPTATRPRYESLRKRRDRDPSSAAELIHNFIEALLVLRRSDSMPWMGKEACRDCVVVLRELAGGLELRVMTRGEATELLTEAAHRLRDVQRNLPLDLDLGSGLKPQELVVALAEQLQTIGVVVARMFDDAYDNISIEY